MKGVTFPPSIIQRVVARRGTKHIFSDLDPKRTALVVVDLQNAFMDDEVGHAVCPAARDIVPAVNRLAGAVRTSGGAVFWIKNTFDESCLTEWSVMQDISTPAMRVKRAAAMSEATKGHELWPTLDVRPEDEIVKKFRFSAFLPGASERARRGYARPRGIFDAQSEKQAFASDCDVEGVGDGTAVVVGFTSSTPRQARAQVPWKTAMNELARA